MKVELSDFNKVIITGPQRAGTTICAQMMASDFKVKYMGEESVGFYSEAGIRSLCEGSERFVLQCPRAAHACHKFIYEDVAIVFMYRNSHDIKVSQDRINWTNSYEKDELSFYHLTQGTISTIKYSNWRTWQKELIPNSFEIWYEDLQAHKFWKDKSERVYLSGRETYVEGVNSWVQS